MTEESDPNVAAADSAPEPEAPAAPDRPVDAETSAAEAADEAMDATDESKVVNAVAEATAIVAEPTPAAAPLSLELHFLRHADAGDPMTWPGDDAGRPLSKKGRGQAKRLGSLLSDLDVRVDVILTSPRLRSVDTARLVAKAIGVKAHVDDRLGIDFGEDTLASLVGELDANARSVILVGHDPDFTHLVSWLVGASITMRKGALARVDLADRTVSAGRGSLRWLLPPDAVAR
jgi:phosphohistidine phosphatase SixA